MDMAMCQWIEGERDMNRMQVIKDEQGVYVDREMVYAPTEWQKLGLCETATGYGSRLNSGYKVIYAGKLRRVYTVCYSNVGSCFVMVKGKRVFLGI